jgi:hypothetical protein
VYSQNQHIVTDFEEIFIHTDKSIYAPGEDIWFKAYILEDEYHIPSGKSNLLYLNLVDFKGDNIISEKFLVQNGFSNGDFQLSDTLKKGTYQIVAFTENMKKHDPKFWYRSDLVIDPTPVNLWDIAFYPELNKLSESVFAGEINCLASSGFPIADVKIQYIIESDGEKVYSETYKTDSLGKATIVWNIPDKIKNKDLILHVDANYLNKNKNLKINIPRSKEGIDLKFYPEGGSLVQGLLNNVAFKVNDQYGSPLTIKGTLMNQYGDQILKIETTHEGMGIFSFIPNPNESYSVKLDNPDLDVSLYELPEVRESGYVLSLLQSEKSVITFKINMTPDLKGKKVNLSISNGLAYENLFESVLESEKRFSFLTSSLPVGIAKLSLFSDEIPVAERLVFLNKHKKLRLSIETEKEIYDPREKVEMTIRAVDFEGNPTSANLSLAVSEKSKQISDQQDISSYLLLGSKLKGNINNLSYYLEENEKADSALNILLMTHGWSKIERFEEYTKVILNPENITGIQGTVYTKKNKTAKNAQVQIIDTKTWQVITTQTNDFGRFFIPIDDYFSIAGNQNLSISAALPNSAKDLIILLDPEIEKDILFKFKLDEDFSLAYNMPEKKSILHKAASIEYTNFDETSEFIEEVVVTAQKHNPVLEEAKKEVYNEYKMTAEELHTNMIVMAPSVTSITAGQDHSILELIRPVAPTFEIINGKIVFRGRNSIMTENVTGALFVVNGVPMGSNITNMAWVNPLDVKEVKVITSPGAAIKYGSSCTGLIEITMLEGNENELKQVNIAKDESLCIIKGYKLCSEFYSPDYSVKIKESEKTFDSRSTLYWNPNLILDNSGEQIITFFNGDKRTFFQCKLFGIDGSGLMGSSKITLRIN